MCGRYTLGVGAEELVEAFDVPELTFDHRPRYNIAPGQDAPVLARDRRGRRVGPLTWGLVPGWSDEPGAGSINARAESVATKPSFREAFARRRCLVPATGFYEWRRVDGRKVPHWFHPPDGGIVTFAGIWERWARPGVEPRHTFAILTTDANQDVEEVHDRMPVVVADPDRKVWLDRESDPHSLRELLAPAPPGTLDHHAVDPRVGRPENDDESLVEPWR